MKNNNCCPICGRQYPDENDRNKKYVRSKKSCTKKNMKDGYLYYHCEFFDFDFLVKENIVCMTDIELKEKLFDLMVEHMLHQKNCVVKCSSRDWCFYFDDICENEADIRMYAEDIFETFETEKFGETKDEGLVDIYDYMTIKQAKCFSLSTQFPRPKISPIGSRGSTPRSTGRSPCTRTVS